MRMYYKVLFHSMKWVATAFVVVAVIIVGCVLIDWLGKAGWGYPWYSLPLALGMIGLGLMIRKILIAAIRYDSN